LQFDSTSQAMAGSSPVGSPWKVTVNVPPLTGVVLAGLLEPLLELLPHAATPTTSAARASSDTATLTDLRAFIPDSLPRWPPRADSPLRSSRGWRGVRGGGWAVVRCPVPQVGRKMSPLASRDDRHIIRERGPKSMDRLAEASSGTSPAGRARCKRCPPRGC